MNKKLKQDIEDLIKEFPSLDRKIVTPSGVFIYGKLQVKTPEDNIIWGNFDVKIYISNNYPRELPKIYDLSNITPKTTERHIGVNGGCCLAPPAEEFIILGHQYSLIDFINKLVIPFFATQILYNLGKGWHNGEYSHYGKGLLEYYSEKTSLKSKELVINLLNILTGKIKIGRNDDCFCGSNLKYKKCHLNIIDIFKFVPREVFVKDLIAINCL